MGYELVAEIMTFRPARPGPEWWLLYELAQDADDGTRRTACGLEYMMARTHAPKSTVSRWLQKLTSDNLIRVARRSRSAGRNGGKGERAVYEIQIPPALVDQVTATLNRVPVVRSDSSFDAHKKGNDYRDIDASRMGTDSGANPQVSGNRFPKVRPPLYGPLGDALAEGAKLRSGQDLSDTKTSQTSTATNAAALPPSSGARQMTHGDA